MKTLIVGLGNPILGDDGVGWKVAEEVKKQLTSLPSPFRRLQHSTAPAPVAGVRQHARFAKQIEVSAPSGGAGGEVNIEFLSLGGISLMEHLIGYERAILIDAITSDQENGSVIVSNLNDMPDYSAFHIASAHDTSLQNALKLGKSMGARLPKEIIIVGIATDHIYDFSESLSPTVEQAVSKAANIVISVL